MRSRKRRGYLLAAIVAALMVAPSAAQAGTEPAVTATDVGSFEQPVFVTSAPGKPNLLFVVQQPGKVKVLRNGEKAGTFLDISKRVGTLFNEQGLLSIAFPPN